MQQCGARPRALLIPVQLGGAGGQLQYCLPAVLRAPAGVGSRRERHRAPGGAGDAEDVFVEFTGEEGFESCTSYIRWSWGRGVLAVATALAL